jgi:predicted amidohydrolase
MVRITVIQLRLADRSKEENLAMVLRLLDEAPPSDLLLLPELWPSGFFSFDWYREESEEIDGPLVGALRQKVAERATYTMIGSFVERSGNEYYNTALMLDPQGEVLARYRKVHLFGFQSRERSLLTPGEGPVVFDLPWGRAGITTCYDLRFPELYRLMVDDGASIFLIPSAWPMARLAAWRLFNQARAHENLAYLISCNCAGESRGTAFAGHSMIVDPLGKIIAETAEQGCYLTAEIDPQLAATARRNFSALDDRVYRVIDRRLPLHRDSLDHS